MLNLQRLLLRLACSRPRHESSEAMPIALYQHCMGLGFRAWNLKETFGGFSKMRGTFLGVPIVRLIVFSGLYWGPPYLVGKLPFIGM